MKRAVELLSLLVIISLTDPSLSSKHSAMGRQSPMTMVITVPTPYTPLKENRIHQPNYDKVVWNTSIENRLQQHQGTRSSANYDSSIMPVEGRSFRNNGETSSRDIRTPRQQPGEGSTKLPQFYDATERTQHYASNAKSLRFNARREEQFTKPQQHTSRSSTMDRNYGHTEPSVPAPPSNKPQEEGRNFELKGDPSKFFREREERRKMAFNSRVEPRKLAYLEEPLDHTSTEGLVKFSTSFPFEDEDEKSNTFIPVTEEPEIEPTTENDRLALIRSRHRDRPQLVFLADDPEAASRLPDLLTTLYDNVPTTRLRPGGGFSYAGRSGIITAASQEETEIQTSGPETVQIYPQISSDRDLDLPGVNYRGGHSADYFPPRHRPPFGAQEKDLFDDFSSFSSGALRPPPAGGFQSAPARQPTNFSARRPANNMTRVTHIEAECQDDFMRIHVVFNGSFEGLVYSSGYSHDLDCVYINGSGKHSYDFYIKLNRCGTLGANDLGDSSRPMQKNVMWNTLTVQYNPMIEEEWDEHFKVTCEYGLEIWKTVTFPFLDVEVQTGNPMMFSLNPPECHMEIRLGFSPDGKRVSSPVRVGDPLTLVIYMRSQYDGFDIVVSDCFAHNGGTKKILLIDSYGCPVDDKLISHFDGQSLKDGLFETQVFAYMKTFRFTGSPALYIECGVRMCHGDCPTQLCHWRRSRNGRARRSVAPDDESAASTNVSESLHLFQALQVINDGSPPFGAPSIVSDKKEEFCFKPNHFSVVVAAGGGLLSIFAIACFILCFRLRRLGKGSSERMSLPSASSHHPQRSYRSGFVPPVKRRLE